MKRIGQFVEYQKVLSDAFSLRRIIQTLTLYVYTR